MRNILPQKIPYHTNSKVSSYQSRQIIVEVRQIVWFYIHTIMNRKSELRRSVCARSDNSFYTTGHDLMPCGSFQTQDTNKVLQNTGGLEEYHSKHDNIRTKNQLTLTQNRKLSRLQNMHQKRKYCRINRNVSLEKYCLALRQPHIMKETELWS